MAKTVDDFKTVWIFQKLVSDPFNWCSIRFVLITAVFVLFAGTLASTGAPYFIEEPSDTYVEKGKSAILNCLVGGNPKPAVTWRRNGIALHLSSGGRRTIKPNGSLYFSEIIDDKTSKPDEGTYQCEALSQSDMSLDYQILSRTARLVVAGRPSSVEYLFNPCGAHSSMMISQNV